MSFRFPQKSVLTGVIVLCVISLMLGSIGLTRAESSAITKVYLPLVIRPPEPKLMLGMYIGVWTNNQDVLNNYHKAIDAWSGKKLSLAGTFLAIDVTSPEINVAQHLTLLWNNGYTPYVNIEIHGSTPALVVAGTYDAHIRTWANAFKTYAEGGGGRSAFLIPFPEMNGNWTSYYVPGSRGGEFINAYRHFKQVFESVGLPAGSARWVFGSNGLADPGDEFEYYYPGDAYVDAVGFSAYNFGRPANLCPNADWQNPEEVYNNPYLGAPWVGYYLDRMHSMAPSKPIFISQTGTTSFNVCGGPSNTAMKNAWLRDAYNYLAEQRGVAGVIYFNLTNWQGYDWPFYVPGDPAHQYSGYVEGVSNPAYQYISPTDLKNEDLTP